VLPSEYPEVQNYPHLKKLLADHIDMQFEDATRFSLQVADSAGRIEFMHPTR
jgi:hypothetical protein